MDPTLLATLTACAVVVAVGAAVLAALAHRRVRAELDAVRLELSALQARVDQLVSGPGAQASEPLRDEDEFVITTLATPAQGSGLASPEAGAGYRPSGADVVSVAVGESLVKVVSLAHGIRRALSPQNRNRIAFEVRREVKRSRRQRRRDVREAQRDVRLRRDPASGEATRRDAA